MSHNWFYVAVKQNKASSMMRWSNIICCIFQFQSLTRWVYLGGMLDKTGHTKQLHPIKICVYRSYRRREAKKIKKSVNCSTFIKIHITLNKIFWLSQQRSEFRVGFDILHWYMRWQDIRVPPLDIGHLSFSNLFLWGNQCEFGGCLDSRLLGCLGNFIL